MRRTAGVVLVVLVGLVACGQDGDRPGDKAGGQGGITTLRMATPDPPGRPASRQAADFAERVRDLSDGRLRIDIRFEAQGPGVPGWDQVVAQRVVDGDEELGLVPARAWDELGVTTLQPLQAPFLVTSDDAVDAVLTDDVALGLMAGLDEVGLTGLALLPDSVRHPVAVGAPLLEPADYAGQLIRAPRSAVTWAALRALGADPQDLAGSALTAAVREGRVRGAESAVDLLPFLPLKAAVTANVAFYVKTNVLVVRDEALEELSAGEVSVLRRAALQTRDAAVADRTRDPELLREACRTGVRVAIATDEQVQALRAATAPVMAGLRSDPEVAELLDRVTRLVGRTTSTPFEQCNAGDSPEQVAGDPATALDGVWRIDVSYEDGIDAGLPHHVAAGELGVQTVRMQSGAYEWTWRSRVGEKTCPGTYSAEGPLIVFTDGQQCGGSWEARPSVAGDEITWTDVRTRVTGDPHDQLVRELLHRPWRRIEAPAGK
jgi:TRAP-type C4-dicarboxylate transport system substrate-binding protein